MKKRDLIILAVGSIIIIGVLVFAFGKGSSGPAPQPPNVTPVNPNFDTQTITRVEQNFPVDLDLTGLGRQDPFAGI